MPFDITWIDHHREPQCKPDPDFPKGKHINVVSPPSTVTIRIDDPVAPPAPAAGRCTVVLPYPAKRCGMYMVKCQVCNMTVGVTTAGRPDDPRSITFPCNESPLKAD